MCVCVCANPEDDGNIGRKRWQPPRTPYSYRSLPFVVCTSYGALYNVDCNRIEYVHLLTEQIKRAILTHTGTQTGTHTHSHAHPERAVWTGKMRNKFSYSYTHNITIIYWRRRRHCTRSILYIINNFPTYTHTAQHTHSYTLSQFSYRFFFLSRRDARAFPTRKITHKNNIISSTPRSK